MPVVWTRLALAASLLMGVASGAGVYVEGVYAKETPSWALQGVGQDIANLFVAFPLLVAATVLTGRGSVRASLVWLGLLLYVAYSYVLYAFFVHFGPWFLVYVGALGFSVYALAGGAAHVGRVGLARRVEDGAPVRIASAFLMIVTAMFATLWLSEILPALLSGGAPQSVKDVGLPVNPVHVLDLAILLPATAAVSVQLWNRRPVGLLFVVPVLVFLAVMGVAIMAMAFVLRVNDLPAPAGMIVAVGAVTLASVALAITLLGRIAGVE